jgi:hypothetical protein
MNEHTHGMSQSIVFCYYIFGRNLNLKILLATHQRERRNCRQTFFFLFYLKQNNRLHARYNSLLLNYVQHDVQMSVYRREKKEKRQKKKESEKKREFFSRLALIVNVEDRRQS